MSILSRSHRRARGRGFLILLAVWTVVNAAPPLRGQAIRVVKRARDRDPTLVYRGIMGDQALSRQVGSDLVKCGWFDVVSSADADYSLAGAVSGGTVTVNVGGAASFALKARMLPGDPRRTAHKVVDAVLKRLFGIDGICSSRIAFCAELAKGVKEIYMCDFDGSNLQRLTRNGTLSVEPDWTPKNRSVVYTMYGRGVTDVVEYDIPSTRSRRLAHFPGLNAGAAVSPNGKLLALILSKDRRVELYVKTLSGRGERRLTNSSAVEASPCWSPGGRRLCFVSDRSGRPRLQVIGANGGGMKSLPTLGSESVCPSWSKENKIAYSAKMGPNYSLAVLDLTGKDESGVIVEAAGDWESPSWAPDGRHVVCSRDFGGKSSLYVIDAWTKKARPLLRGKRDFSMPSWSGLR